MKATHSETKWNVFFVRFLQIFVGKNAFKILVSKLGRILSQSLQFSK